MKSKTIASLLPTCFFPPKIAAIEVTGLALDSRLVRPGDMFFAFPGAHFDGREYVEQAIYNGARVIVQEDDVNEVRPDQEVVIVKMPNVQSHLGDIASRFYGRPSEALNVIGVTGTNGKSSVVDLFCQALTIMDEKVGIIGTLGAGLYPDYQSTGYTTPFQNVLQQSLFKFSEQDAEHAVMEVSSHSLVQQRISGVRFSGAIFTNLSRDHLDYHESMEDYFQAKKLLFTQFPMAWAVINTDSPEGCRLIEEGISSEKVIGYGFEKIHPISDKVVITDLKIKHYGQEIALCTPVGDVSIVTSLMGEFNALNIAAVVAGLVAMDFNTDEVSKVLQQLRPVKGRLEVVAREPLVIIDYAHTPDALVKALQAVRAHCDGKLWVIFGCGGDRDVGKRPLMMQAALAHADHVVVTSDNPRTEDPQKIINDIIAGSSCTDVVLDRKQAIEQTLAKLAPNDVLLIAGKGHEQLQIIGDQKVPFNEGLIVNALLS